jgi:three-Cys-motif partner protein
MNAKTTMLLHSEAKVEFFKKYLQRYLRILYLAPTITEINIFDVFCGTGIYDNGKKGSPIVAFESIAEVREQYGFTKPINLVVNDSERTKIQAVRQHIDGKNQGHCTATYYELPAEQMFEQIKGTVRSQTKDVRNLIFIDPYGYKKIKKDTLESLLSNQRTEVILFLPISQMQRFTKVAVERDLKPYEPLKEFVFSFFPGVHPIKEQTVKALDYVEFVQDALRFGQYYSTSYYIERDESNYYALFFISPSSYGVEKILEVKWQLDDDSGRGFRQPKRQTSLFEQQDKDLQKNDNYKQLETILEGSLKTPKTNQEIREIVLKNAFLPKHATEIFRNWQSERPKFQVTDWATKRSAKKGSFYIGWESCNPAKNKTPKVIFSLS